MTQMISGKDLARLHMDLHVPSLLADILRKNQSLSRNDDCSLRQAFLELSPLETLISLACCFQILVPHLEHEPDMVEPLLTQSNYILDDYAPHFMRRTFPVTQEWADFVTEDLETTGDFLSVISDAALGVHPAIADICDILNEQAFVKSLSHMPFPANHDNVIRFPIERRL